MAIEQITYEEFMKKLDELERSKLVKKSMAKSKPEAPKKPARVSAAATVLGIIKRSRKGIDFATLKKKTGFEGRKISGIIQRFKKEGKIKSSEKGIYVKA